MFTSRAEFRLSLRADNADQRLTPIGINLGLVKDKRKSIFDDKMNRLETAKSFLDNATFTPRQINQVGMSVNNDGQRRSAFQLLAFPEIGFDELTQLDSKFSEIDDEIQDQLNKDALYANYIQRQQKDVEAVRRDEAQPIPIDFIYDDIEGLSNELKLKLSKTKPDNLAQAARIDGMTPAALTLLLAKLRQRKRQEKSA